MRFIPLLLILCGLPALAEIDPVQACRDAHAGDPQAHIACLEAALAGRTGAAERPVPAPEPAREPAPVATPAQEPTGLGADQVRSRTQISAEPVQVIIVAVSYNAAGLGTFRMSDGQVWRETTPSPERRRLKPGREYPARIEVGRVGGFRLFVEGVRWMKTVERLE
jgi:lipoprotein-anchoring transpeptidase ErfK/SrfK